MNRTTAAATSEIATANLAHHENRFIGSMLNFEAFKAHIDRAKRSRGQVPENTEESEGLMVAEGTLGSLNGFAVIGNPLFPSVFTP